MSNEINLVAKSLSVGYDKKNIVLSEINFSIANGLTALVGENGSGKSTLLKTFAGLLNPISGSCLLNNETIHKFSSETLSKKISIVLTDKLNLPYFKAIDVVGSGRMPHASFTGKLSSSDYEIVEKIMSDMKISSLSEKYFNELSDGQKQKCMIARAVVQETSVILMDEPTSYLDYRAKREIMEILQQTAISLKKIILFSSHDTELVKRISENCFFIENGKVILKECDQLEI
jgi:iron complex transport system ATP-binding protein